VIAGFPGESEADFRASLDYVREMGFAGGHAFTYSPMAGTVAALRRDHIPAAVRRSRNRMYLEAFTEAAHAFRCSHVGEVRPVLWESTVRVNGSAWQLSGLTDNYIRVKVLTDEPRWNEVDQVCLREESGDGLLGILAKTG